MWFYFFYELRQNISLSIRNETKFSRNKTKFLRNEAKFRFNFCETKRNFASIFVVRNETKRNFAYFCFAKQAKFSRNRRGFRIISCFAKLKKKRKLKTLIRRFAKTGALASIQVLSVVLAFWGSASLTKFKSKPTGRDRYHFVLQITPLYFSLQLPV